MRCADTNLLLWAGRPLPGLTNAELAHGRNTLLRQAKRAHCELLALLPLGPCCPALEEASGHLTTAELLPPLYHALVEELQLRDALSVSEYSGYRRVNCPA